MIKKIEEWKVPMNGRMRDNFNLFFRVSQESTEDGPDVLNTRLRIERTNDNDESRILVEKVDSKIILDSESRGTQKDLYFLGQNNNLILCTGSFKVPDDKPYVQFKALVNINDDIGYLRTTEIDETFIISKKQISKEPTIVLDFTNTPLVVDVTAVTNSKYDLLEFKVNDNNWVNNDSYILHVAKTNKKQFIQSRMKIENNYYYSNILTIE